MTSSDPGRAAFLTVRLVVCLAGGIWGLVACGRDGEGGFVLHSAAARGEYQLGAERGPGLALHHEPELAEITLDHERRPVVLLPAGAWTWSGVVPRDGWLQVGVQLPSEAAGGFEAQVLARYGSTTEILDRVRGEGGAGSEWLDMGVDLSHLAGRRVTLELSSAVTGQEVGGDESGPTVAWGPVSLSGAGGKNTGPNILLILVDTLRFDHLTPYGYSRNTTPHIQRLLAQPGVVVEEAYAQAPWTLPSLVSLMTGRYPGELVEPSLKSFEIAPEVESLAQRMGELGYETAAFVANPALQEWNGFGGGFATFYTPEAEIASMHLHAEDELQGRVENWLKAHQRDRFFLYVHYIDPHDPYVSPGLVNHRSSFEPDYPGKLRGDAVHGIYLGQTPLSDPEADVRHLKGLYDEEVDYVDQRIGELLESLAPEVLAQTLVVLTADHGEELYDHQGWKHGESVYEEQIHVPLVLRWDGRIPSGTRLKGTVSLVDLAPTLVAAATGHVGPPQEDAPLPGHGVTGGPGLNLLPYLLGEGPLPRRPAFAQHLSWGPLRAAAVLGRQKLILFNRESPFQPPDSVRDYLWRKDVARMARVELYDLAVDPGETRNLAGQRPQLVTALAPVIHRRLNDHLTGLRVLASGIPPGSRLSARLVLDEAPREVLAYFLSADDRYRVEGRSLILEVQGEAWQIARGVILEGGFSQLEEIEVRVDGEPLACSSVLLGPTAACGSGDLSRRRWKSATWPEPPPGPALRLFWPAGPDGWGSEGSGQPDLGESKTIELLRSLGYLP